MSRGRPRDQDIIIAGARGDLARRKLWPALYNLHLDGLLPEHGRIIGYGRNPGDDASIRQFAEEAVRAFSRRPLRKRAWGQFAKRMAYAGGDDGTFASVVPCAKLPERLIYLAIPPSAFLDAVRAIAAAGLADGAALVVEKPFGRDYQSGCELTRAVAEVFDERRVFRIDHFLGKETVQNIFVFRFANSVFERVWHRDAVDHIQFTVAESIGIEGRARFYEETGALRDILQNHVFQVLALLAMEPPANLRPESVRDEKAKLFEAMRPLTPADVVRGQYLDALIDGRRVPAYREEEGVAPGSQTETYAAVRLHIDNWRWAGVPFYLRTGKRLPRKTSEVTVVFREAPLRLFAGTPVSALKPDQLTIHIGPHEDISFQFLAKKPGSEIRVEPVQMDFAYDAAFTVQPAEAYERLLHDALVRDQTLFARADMVERAWEVVQPVLDDMPPLHFYRPGTWGPGAADDLIAPRLWHLR
jgi:glucose-6-phosphate 1-dehydrogenase